MEVYLNLFITSILYKDYLSLKNSFIDIYTTVLYFKGDKLSKDMIYRTLDIDESIKLFELLTHCMLYYNELVDDDKKGDEDSFKVHLTNMIQKYKPIKNKDYSVYTITNYIYNIRFDMIVNIFYILERIHYILYDRTIITDIYNLNNHGRNLL